MVEAGAPPLELLDRPRRTVHELADDPRIAEPVPLGQAVGRVLVGGVLGIHRAEGRVDAPGGEHGVSVLSGALGHDEHLDAALGDLDRRPESCTARADDEDAGRLLPFEARKAHVLTSGGSGKTCSYCLAVV